MTQVHSTPVRITSYYKGDLKVRVTHQLSGTELTTAAPLDNQGDGSSFSPTDLVAAALGSCILTIVGIVAQRRSIVVDGAHVEVEKSMSTTPRRIGKLPVIVHLPNNLSTADREALEKAALNCPVHHSLHPDIESTILFEYDVTR